MKIWQLNFELDDYDNLVPINEFTVEEIQSFDGRSHLRQWKPVQVKRMEPEKGLELSDAPGFTIPVFSRRAWECLEPLISKNIFSCLLSFVLHIIHYLIWEREFVTLNFFVFLFILRKY